MVSIVTHYGTQTFITALTAICHRAVLQVTTVHFVVSLRIFLWQPSVPADYVLKCWNLYIVTLLCGIKGKGKGKGHPRTGCVDPEGE
jgi:hypothetical protein